MHKNNNQSIFEKDLDQEPAKKLTYYLQSINSTAQQFTFDNEVRSVEQASSLLGSSPDKFVKTVCFEDNSGVFVAVIVLGWQKVEPTNIQDFLGCGKLKPASKENILSHTGYEIGGIPPVGYFVGEKSKFFVDKEVVKKDVVFAGGGDRYTLLEIKPNEILRLNNGLVLDCARKIEN